MEKYKSLLEGIWEWVGLPINQNIALKKLFIYLD